MAPADDEGEVSEYLCTLQPHSRSELAQALLARRASCELAGFDVDSAWLYPPHVSVTGFFTATQQQAQLVCDLARCELDRARQAHAAESESRISCNPVEVGEVLTTESGHVLLDIVAPSIAKLSAALAQRAVECGVPLRSKAVRHLSLAAGRDSARERAAIAALHEELPRQVYADWDLVVARVVRRSDVEALRREGRRHQFSDVLRLPLAPGARHEGPLPTMLLDWPSSMSKAEALLEAAADCSFCNESSAISRSLDCSLCNGTPMKKRPWSWAGEDGCRPTPPKITKVALSESLRSACCKA